MKKSASTIRPAWFVLGNQEHYVWGKNKPVESHILAIREDLEMWPLTSVNVLQAIPMTPSLEGGPNRDAERGCRNVLEKIGEIHDKGLKDHFEGYRLHWVCSASNSSAEFIKALLERILDLPGAFKTNEQMAPDRKISTPIVSESSMTF